MENSEEKNSGFEVGDIEYDLLEGEISENEQRENKNETEADFYPDETNKDKSIIIEEKEKTGEVQIFSIGDNIFSEEEQNILQKYFHSVKPEEKTFDLSRVSFQNEKELERFEEISKEVLSLHYTLKYLKESSSVKKETPSDNRKTLLKFLESKDKRLTNDKVIFILKELYYNKEIENEDIIRKRILLHLDKKELDEILEKNFKERTALFHIASKLVEKILDIQDTTKNKNVSLLEDKNNEIEYLQNELDKTRSLCSKKENKIEELKYEIQDMQIFVSENEKDINTDDCSEQKEMIISLNNKINELEDANKSAQEMITQLETERNEALKSQESNNNEDLLNQIEEKNRKIDALNFEIEELIQTQKELERQNLEQQNEKIEVVDATRENKKETKQQQEIEEDTNENENPKQKTNLKKKLLYGFGGFFGVIILVIIGISFVPVTKTQNDTAMSSTAVLPVKKQDTSSAKNSTKLTPEVFTQNDNNENKMNVKSNDFISEKTKDEMQEYNYDIYTDNPLVVRINNKKFKSMDVINGWEFRKTVPSFRRIYFTKAGTDGAEMLVIKMK